MNWFERMKKGLKGGRKKEIPDGLWIKCERCGEIFYRKDLEDSLWVCKSCGYHFRIGYSEYIKILLDDGSFEEINPDITSADPLDFEAKERYSDKIEKAVKSLGIKSAVVTGFGEMGGRRVAVGIMDFRFIGGSMGSAVGEKVSRLIDAAAAERTPLIIVSQSGGARMQESALSLMQMAKTSAKLRRFSNQGLLYISVMTHPTSGGVSASYAMLGDINIAEPGALIGFAGPRVIKEALGGGELPEDFQKSESVLKHGFLDMVVDRRELKGTISRLMALFVGDSDESVSPVQADREEG